MTSRGHYRPASPRRIVIPGRSSTGTFSETSYDPYYSTTRSGREVIISPRTSGERIVTPSSHHTHHHHHHTPTSAVVKSSDPKFDTYSGRPRRNTATEQEVRIPRPTPSIPIRTHGNVIHTALDRPPSPLARSWDSRGDTYVTPSTSSAPRKEHTKLYDADDSRSAKLIAEREVEPRRRDSREQGDYRASGGRTYRRNAPITRPSGSNDEYYSYTDAAGMYRDTEPSWRRPRHSSLERDERPSSLIMDSAGGPRVSSRGLGPPPSTRGFDKINNGIARSGSLHEHGQSSSKDRSIDYGAYREADPYGVPPRASTIQHHHPVAAVHQDPRDDRRDDAYAYREGHDDRRERDSRRHMSGGGRFEDPDVASRGFGIRPAGDSYPSRDDGLEDPIWDPRERGRPGDNYPDAFYAENDPRYIPDLRPQEPRSGRDRDPPYRDDIERDRELDRDRQREQERPRDRDRERERYKERDGDRDRRDRDLDDRIPGAAPIAAAGAATAYGAAELAERKYRDRDDDGERDRAKYRDRDGDRDRRERDQASIPIGAVDRVPRDRKYDDDDDRSLRHRKGHSSDESGDERPRHYVDRDTTRDRDDRMKESRDKADAALDPDEEYRRRVQQESKRSGKESRDHDASDSEREERRRRRERERHEHGRDDRDRAGERDNARLPPPPPKSSGTKDIADEDPSRSRHKERSNSVLDARIVQEPDSLALIEPTTDRDGNRVRIVSPPRDSPPPVKSILRKPTDKFPEDPNPIREGVALPKDAKKGKDIPPGARWTKIDRRLVNPEVLNEAKERFEERMDCVIVLRVLTKEDIQKLADRTDEIRRAREDDNYRDRRDRDRRSSHRSSRRDDEGRDRHRDSYSEEDERNSKPRMIESGQ